MQCSEWVLRVDGGVDGLWRKQEMVGWSAVGGVNTWHEMDCMGYTHKLSLRERSSPCPIDRVLCSGKYLIFNIAINAK